jgi:hypothetical protein
MHARVRRHRGPDEYRSLCQRTPTLLRREAARRAHRKLEHLMARTRTTSRSRRVRCPRDPDSGGAAEQPLEDSLVPSRRALNSPQRGCVRAIKGRLPRNKLVFLRSRYVTFVACQSSQHPFRTVRELWHGPPDDIQPRDIGKGIANNGGCIHCPPGTLHAPDKGKESRIHR